MFRPESQHRDDVEETEFDTLQLIEGMPTSIGAFKNHPLCVSLQVVSRNVVSYVVHDADPHTSRILCDQVRTRAAPNDH